MSHRRRTKELEPRIAKAVRYLHNHYPYLGHDGIARLLKDEGIKVDPHDLRVFMEDHNIKAEPEATWVHSSDPKEALWLILGGPVG